MLVYQFGKHFQTGIISNPATSYPCKGLSILSRRREIGLIGFNQRRLKRLAERHVEMDDTFAHPVGGGVGAGGGRAQVADQQRIGVGFRQRHVHRPQRVIPVQLDLIDGLVRAAVAQFRRAIPGQDDQRHLQFVRLDDGRKEVGGRRAGNADQRDRLIGLEGDAEREKAGAALVQMRIDFDAGMCAKASVSGVERDPGAIQAARSPARASSSTTTVAHSRFRLGADGKRLGSCMIGYS